MSTEQIESMLPVARAKQVAPHPLAPLSSSEITKSADFIRDLYPSGTNFQFKSITLQEPEKAELVPFLEAEHYGQKTPHIDRKTFVNYYIRNTVSTWTSGHKTQCNANRLANISSSRINSTKLWSI